MTNCTFPSKQQITMLRWVLLVLAGFAITLGMAYFLGYAFGFGVIALAACGAIHSGIHGFRASGYEFGPNLRVTGRPAMVLGSIAIALGFGLLALIANVFLTMNPQ
jgi:hypothetical protein